MRSGLVAVVFAGLVVVVGITYAFVRARGTVVAERPPVAATAAASSAVVQVDELAADPDKFKGEIVLRAVVAGVKKSEGVFGVIDAREFESCGVLECNDSEILPVKFAGELPKPKTLVRIVGRVVRGERGLVFDARRVDAAR